MPGLLEPLHRPMPFNCWISPDGHVHKVGLWGHEAFAIERSSKEYGYEPPALRTAGEFLHERGWARIVTRSEISYAQVVTSDRHPSRKIYEGIYEAYRLSGYGELWEWLRDEGYIQTRQVEGLDISPKDRTV